MSVEIWVVAIVVALATVVTMYITVEYLAETQIQISHSETPL